MEIISLEKEYDQIRKLIEKLTAILASEAKLLKVIKTELLEIKKKYADDRRTTIVEDSSKAEIKTEDLIHIEDVVIALTRNQDVKRIPMKSFNRSNRDVDAVDTRDMDYVEFLVESATNHRVLFMTDMGNCYGILGKDIPEAKWRDKGVPLVQLLNGFDISERIVGVVSVADFNDEQYIQFYSEGGIVKRTLLSAYDSRNTKIIACGLAKDDKIIAAELIDGKSDTMIVTEQGMSICFRGSEINPTGRPAIGVKAIQLKKNDRVIFA